MSIINKMLRDIDDRENKPAEQTTKPSDVYLPKPAQDRRATFVLAGGAVAVLLLVGLWWGSSMDDPAMTSPTAVGPAQVAMASEQVSDAETVTNAADHQADREYGADEFTAAHDAEIAADTVEDTSLVASVAPDGVAESEATQMSASIAGQSASQNAGQSANPSTGQSNPTQRTQTSSDTRVAAVAPTVSTTNTSSHGTGSMNSTASASTNSVASPSSAASTNSTARTSTPEMRVSRASNGADSAEAAYREGMRLLRAGNQPAALQQFRTAVERDNMHHEARLELVVLLFSRGVVEESLQLLSTGVMLAPHFNEFRLVEARILQRIGQPEAALEVLNGTSAVLPTDADIFIMRGALATELGYYGVAVHSYQQLVSWRPDSGAWWLGLGYALELRGDKRDASDAYQRALRDSRLGADSRRFVMNRLEVIGS